MERDEIEQLIYRILATRDEEIDCDQVFELIARYVDLEVSGEDVARLLPLVYQHLVQCNKCSELHETLYELAVLEAQDALPEVDDLLDEILVGEPSPTAERRPHAPAVSPIPPLSTDSGRTLPATTTSQARDERRQRITTPTQPLRWLRWGWALAAAALLIAVMLGVWGWQQSSETVEMKREMAFMAQADRTLWVRGTEQDPDVRGYLFVDETSKQGLLVSVGLGPLSSERVYQMWIMADENDFISLGTFTVRADQPERVWVDLSPASTPFTYLSITVEPAGGSPAPTSPPVCLWQTPS